MTKVEFTPSGVCSSKMIVETDGNIIKSVDIIGGCSGNSQGVARLCEGRDIDEVIEIISGIDCRGRGTSCPDQLSKALIKIKEKEKVTN